jgi:O-antigen/teichoic acid export membrane protein
VYQLLLQRKISNPLSGIKKLAGQTLWYGVPTIASRFLGYLMNLTLPLIFAQPSKTADLTQVYAIIPFLNVLFTYGLETAYFRFSQETDKKKLYNTLSVSLIASAILFTSLLFIFKGTIAEWASLEAHPEYINWMAGIIFFDTICTLAFARLRQENRPKRYAFARLASVVMNILVVVIFMGLLPKYLQNHPDSFLKNMYAGKDSGIVYYLIGNFCGSVLTFILLRKELSQIQFSFDKALWKKIMRYAYPLVIVGMGGIVNDMLSRLIYQHVVDLPAEQAKHELGVFANIIRLSILITIAIQAFRMAAEPFFFNRSKEENAPKTYARVMKFFILVCCFLFLGISLYIDVVKWFFLSINRSEWTEGLYVVPLFAMANIFLGIYYNLSIWYKLTNKNMMGAAITIAGAVITIALNVLLIPKFHYLGAAIATFCCYLFMMITSYVLGQKHYPVPYAKKKLIAYLVLVVLIVLTHRGVVYLWDNRWFNLTVATFLFGFFTWFVGLIERKELEKMPVVGRFYGK